jgi:hypothetical protein
MPSPSRLRRMDRHAGGHQSRRARIRERGPSRLCRRRRQRCQVLCRGPKRDDLALRPDRCRYQHIAILSSGNGRVVTDFQYWEGHHLRASQFVTLSLPLLPIVHVHLTIPLVSLLRAGQTPLEPLHRPVFDGTHAMSESHQTASGQPQRERPAEHLDRAWPGTGRKRSKQVAGKSALSELPSAISGFADDVLGTWNDF